MKANKFLSLIQLNVSCFFVSTQNNIAFGEFIKHNFFFNLNLNVKNQG